MSLNEVVINETIKFSMDDSLMEQMFTLLGSSGSLLLDCPWCSTTVLPQAKAEFFSSGKSEIAVKCVYCGKTVNVRMFPGYGFVLDSDVKPTRYTNE